MASIFATIVAIWIIFFLASGTIAYRYSARKMRETGQVPPPYLVYLLRPFITAFKNAVAVPRPLRIVLGLTTLSGGAFFLLIAWVAFEQDTVHRIEPIITISFVGLFVILATVSVYVGVRLIKMANTSERLFKWLGKSNDAA